MTVENISAHFMETRIIRKMVYYYNGIEYYYNSEQQYARLLTQCPVKLTHFLSNENERICDRNPLKVPHMGLDQGFLTGGKFPPWGKYWEFRGEMRAFENCCLFKTAW